VFTHEEKAKISNWLVVMDEQGLGLSPTTLKLEVGEIRMDMPTPFQNGIPGK
jgi:hypothetical protein